MTPPSATALVLAAGAGTRMKSSLSKVLQPILGRPMAGWTLAAAREAGMDAVVVTHHQEDQVRAGLAGEGVRFVRQETLRGTGDAVASGLSELPQEGVVVVLYGDCPAIRGETLQRVLAAHEPGTLRWSPPTHPTPQATADCAGRRCLAGAGAEGAFRAGCRDGGQRGPVRPGPRLPGHAAHPAAPQPRARSTSPTSWSGPLAPTGSWCSSTTTST